MTPQTNNDYLCTNHSHIYSLTMDKNNTLLNPTSIALRIALVLVATALIILFSPRQKSVSYDYSIGKPWKYGQIIADYDFPIYKSEAVIRAESDSAMKHFQPYFNWDASVGNMMIRNFTQEIQVSADFPSKYKSYILEKLGEVYNRGIMDSHDYSGLLDSSFTSVRIEKGKTAEMRQVKHLFTTRSAYQYIMMADSAHFSRDILNRCNLNNYIAVNLHLDKAKTHARKQDLINSVSYASGLVQAGEKIVDRGTIVTEKTASIIHSLMKESQRRNKDSNFWLQIAGSYMVTFFLLFIFITYLYLYRRDYLFELRSVILLYLLITVFAIATSLTSTHSNQYIYCIPMTAIAIVVSVFMDSRTAFLSTLIAILISSLSLQEPYLFIFIEIFSSWVAIYSLKQLATRSQLIHTAFLATALTALLMLGIDFSQGHTLRMLDTSWYLSIAINGVLLLFVYPFLFVLEKVFGFTSPITLIEISNINHPLLRELSKQAQGTFNHSMQVANLASEIASKIGADVLLVRTGALYHDIGKMKNPTYFTENQGNSNPHDVLPEERSAQIIIQHVSDGLAIADRYGLPKILKGFIATHHGTSKAGYFYIKYRNDHPNDNINESLFSYPGPNPRTREEAVLMMADSVEAASRSLKEINDESIRQLVDKIVDAKVNDGYFKECPITFRDIQQAKEVLVASLKTIYHTRISYPTLNEPTAQPRRRKKWR